MVRLAPLLAAGALLLHELNGLAGGEAVAGHGHSYLPLAAAVVTVLLALACALYAGELWRAYRHGTAPAIRPSRRCLWLLATLALLTTFALQEWIEGWVTPGHSASLAHALAHLGWLTPALAIALGAVTAALVGASHSAVELLARRGRRHSRPRAERGRWPAPRPRLVPRLPVLASNRAGRAPPTPSWS